MAAQGFGSWPTRGPLWRGFWLRLALMLGLLVCLLPAPLLDAKTPGGTHCFRDICHRVLTLAETAAEIGTPWHIIASHYDIPLRDRFNPSVVTSSGEIFRADFTDNAASPIYPDGTLLAVYVPSTGRGAIVRINNAGPYYSGRLIDLSRGLADQLGIGRRGIARIVVEVLAAPSPHEARYSFGRRYAPVAGYIGAVSGLEAVRAAWRNPSSPPANGVAAVPNNPLAPANAAVASRAPSTLTSASFATPVPPSRVPLIVQPEARGLGPRGRVILRPVKERRPQLMAIIKARKTASARP